YLSARKHHPLERCQIPRDNPQRPRQIGKTRVSDGAHQSLLDRETAHDPPPRWEDRIDQRPKRPAPFHFPRQLFQLAPVTAPAPNPPLVGAPPGPCPHVPLECLLPQFPDNPNLPKAPPGPGR